MLRQENLIAADSRTRIVFGNIEKKLGCEPQQHAKRDQGNDGNQRPRAQPRTCGRRGRRGQAGDSRFHIKGPGEDDRDRKTDDGRNPYGREDHWRQLEGFDEQVSSLQQDKGRARVDQRGANDPPSLEFSEESVHRSSTQWLRARL